MTSNRSSTSTAPRVKASDTAATSILVNTDQSYLFAAPFYETILPR